MYIAVLGASMLVTIIGLAALSASRLERATAEVAADAAHARIYAQSGIELALAYIGRNADWRTSLPARWGAGEAFADGSIRIELVDPEDGDLHNSDLDPVAIRATGIKGQARHIAEVTMDAEGVPIPALAFALHTGGQLHVESSRTLSATGATISTNGTLVNGGTIDGSARCTLAWPVGTVTGELTQLAPPVDMPDSGVIDWYAARGTVISPGGSIDRQVLGPGRNPWGTPNPDGVYVVRADSNLTLSNCRVYGTLVVVAPGRRVRIDGPVLLQPSRDDHPALIVHGDLEIRNGGGILSEAAAGLSFNPPGAPSDGQSDLDQGDTYPAEIQGLVHVRGTVSIEAPAVVRGAIIAESTATADAVVIESDCEIAYDQGLYENPPAGYTSGVRYFLRPGSWRQVVLP